MLFDWLQCCQKLWCKQNERHGNSWNTRLCTSGTVWFCTDRLPKRPLLFGRPSSCNADRKISKRRPFLPKWNKYRIKKGAQLFAWRTFSQYRGVYQCRSSHHISFFQRLRKDSEALSSCTSRHPKPVTCKNLGIFVGLHCHYMGQCCVNVVSYASY